MLTPHEQHGKAKLLATVLAVLIIAGVVAIADHMRSKSPAVAITTTSTPTSTTASGTANTVANSGSTTPPVASGSPTTAASGFTDGTYNATNSYFVPSGDQSIKVDVTLKSGVITAASIQNSESDPTSAQFQEDFAAQYKSYVIGKRIGSLRLSVIAGASDTTIGFSSALNQIASRAKA
jgi:major membrane immunogen (membrane-anchored lipoprotein)